MAADGGAASYDRSGARIQYGVVRGDRRGLGRGAPVAVVSQGDRPKGVFLVRVCREIGTQGNWGLA